MAQSGSAWEGTRLDATPVYGPADLVEALRKRQNEIDIPCLDVDMLAGLANGHYSKITCGIKGIGLQTLFLILPALGMRVVIEEAPNTESMRKRWIRRQGPPNMRLADDLPRRQWVEVAPGRFRYALVPPGERVRPQPEPQNEPSSAVAYDGPTSQGIAGFNSALPLPVSVGGWSGITARSKKRGGKLGLRSIALARAAARNDQDRPAA
jgi:hypothetical protein